MTVNVDRPNIGTRVLSLTLSRDRGGEVFEIVHQDAEGVVGMTTVGPENPNYQRMTDAMHADGGVIGQELMHCAAQAAFDPTGIRRAASALRGEGLNVDCGPTVAGRQPSALHVKGLQVPEAFTRLVIRHIDGGGSVAAAVRMLESLAGGFIGHGHDGADLANLGDFMTRAMRSRGGVRIMDDGSVTGARRVYMVDGTPMSERSGHAFVNGVEYGAHGTGPQRIPNTIGSVVTMPRDEVDPSVMETCSYGLHIGFFNPQDWRSVPDGDGASRLIEVSYRFNDVVCVPFDAVKLRVCRFRVERWLDAGDDEDNGKEL